MSCCMGELGRMNRETWQKLSVGLNVALIGVVAILFLRRATVAPNITSPTAPASSVAAATETDSAASQPRPILPLTNKAASSDWKQWIDSLRAVGVPNRVLARLVQA